MNLRTRLIRLMKIMYLRKTFYLFFFYKAWFEINFQNVLTINLIYYYKLLFFSIQNIKSLIIPLLNCKVFNETLHY